MKLKTVILWLFIVLAVMLALYVAAKLYIIHHPEEFNMDEESKIKLTTTISEESFDFDNDISSLSF